MGQKIVIGVGAILFALFLFVGDRYIAMTQSLPRIEGEIKAPVSAPVEILRDEFGIPHISGSSEDDVFFGLGVAHAQDRMWQMEFTRRVAQGRLSEILGESTRAIDVFFRSIGFPQSVAQSYPGLSQRTRKALKSYSAGVNHILNDPRHKRAPEFTLLFHRPEPWRPHDSLLILKMMSFGLSTNMFHEVRRAQLIAHMGPEKVDRFFPDAPSFGPTLPVSVTELYQKMDLDSIQAALPQFWKKGASNNWVISGAHTTSGKPLLANDPHLELTTPSIWYLAHLNFPDASVIGGTLAGVPSVILGRNEHMAWGFTNTGADVQDLYIEKLNPDNLDEYLTPNGYAPFETREEIIKVRFGDDVPVTVRRTRHGPVMPKNWQQSDSFLEDDHVLALAWTALWDNDTTADAAIPMMLSKDVTTFREKTRHMIHPMQNIVYADRSGDIGFIAPARVPLRKDGNTTRGLLPAPGWLAAYDWDGYIPFEDLPQTHNPSTGQIVTANNKIVPEGYDYDVTLQWEPGYRAARVNELLNITRKHDVVSFQAMQKDVLSPLARQILPLLNNAQTETDEAAEVLARVTSWDAQMRGEKAAPLIFVAWMRALNQRLFQDDLLEHFSRHWSFKPTLLMKVLTDEDGYAAWCDNINTDSYTETCDDILRQSLQQATDELSAAYGPDISSWRWDQAHMSVHSHNPLSNFPLLKDYFELRIPSEGGFYTLNRGGHFFGNANPYSNIHGSGYRAIYDFADLNKSVFLQSTGQSGRPASPFFSNFQDKWARTEYIPMTTDPAVYGQNAAGTLILKPN